MRCDIHGLGVGVEFTCSHVGSVCWPPQAGRELDVHVVIDAATNRYHACAECFAAVVADTRTTQTGARVGFASGDIVDETPVCGPCFEAWLGPARLAAMKVAFAEAVTLFEASLTGPLTAIGLLRECEPSATRQIPSLHELRDKLSPEVVQAVVAYLQRGAVVLDVMEASKDPLDPSHSFPGGPSLVSDGRKWVWRLDLSYYVERYRIALDETFVAELLRGAPNYAAQGMVPSSVVVRSAYNRARR